MPTPSDSHDLAARLLAWYDRNARDLPWRIGPGDRKSGVRPDPYAVWLSEIMLQQTTVPHATPYFHKFLRLWPRVEDLAAASFEDVSREWAGLGYYARARNLHRCAGEVARMGSFPRTRSGLEALPGIGAYTSAAVASIAFDQPVAPVDGNVERVISRLFAIAGDGTPRGWAADKKAITAQVQSLVPEDRPGDFAQAVMDLGATVCAPKSPACAVCPWAGPCRARAEGAIESYPAKPRRKPPPERFGTAFVLVSDDRVLLRRRPPEGLLGGMLMPPSTPWIEAAWPDHAASEPVAADWREIGEVRHVFTHFALRWRVLRADAPGAAADGEWIDRRRVLDAGLPTVGRKAVSLGLSGF